MSKKAVKNIKTQIHKDKMAETCIFPVPVFLYRNYRYLGGSGYRYRKRVREFSFHRSLPVRILPMPLHPIYAFTCWQLPVSHCRLPEFPVHPVRIQIWPRHPSGTRSAMFSPGSSSSPSPPFWPIGSPENAGHTAICALLTRSKVTALAVNWYPSGLHRVTRNPKHDTHLFLTRNTMPDPFFRSEKRYPTIF